MISPWKGIADEAREKALAGLGQALVAMEPVRGQAPGTRRTVLGRSRGGPRAERRAGKPPAAACRRFKARTSVSKVRAGPASPIPSISRAILLATMTMMGTRMRHPRRTSRRQMTTARFHGNPGRPVPRGERKRKWQCTDITDATNQREALAITDLCRMTDFCNFVSRTRARYGAIPKWRPDTSCRPAGSVSVGASSIVAARAGRQPAFRRRRAT